MESTLMVMFSRRLYQRIQVYTILTAGAVGCLLWGFYEGDNYWDTLGFSWNWFDLWSFTVPSAWFLGLIPDSWPDFSLPSLPTTIPYIISSGFAGLEGLQWAWHHASPHIAGSTRATAHTMLPSVMKRRFHAAAASDQGSTNSSNETVAPARRRKHTPGTQAKPAATTRNPLQLGAGTLKILRSAEKLPVAHGNA